MTSNIEANDFDVASSERRIDNRQYMIWRIGLLHHGASRDFCCIKNISAGGFMARVYNNMSVGEVVHIEMKSGQLLQGSVVWERDKHVGVEFRTHIDVEKTLSNQHVRDSGFLPRLPRIQVDYLIRMRCGSRYHSGRLCDISQSGAQIQMVASIAQEEPVLLLLRDFPPVHGSIRWVRGTRAGISFNESVRLESLVTWIQCHRADRSSGLPLDLRGERPASRPRGARDDG